MLKPVAVDHVLGPFGRQAANPGGRISPTSAPQDPRPRIRAQARQNRRGRPRRNREKCATRLLTKLIGCDKMTMRNWEKNYTEPRITHMAGIVEFLGFVPARRSAPLWRSGRWRIGPSSE